MVVTLGQQYNVGEKPTVILCTYIINRHAGTPKQKKNRKKQLNFITLLGLESDGCQTLLYCHIKSLTRQERRFRFLIKSIAGIHNRYGSMVYIHDYSYSSSSSSIPSVKEGTWYIHT